MVPNFYSVNCKLFMKLLYRFLIEKKKYKGATKSERENWIVLFEHLLCFHGSTRGKRAYRSRRMPRVTPILHKACKALQDSDLVKALQSEITHELSSTPFQVLSLFLSPPSLSCWHIQIFLCFENWNLSLLNSSLG